MEPPVKILKYEVLKYPDEESGISETDSNASFDMDVEKMIPTNVLEAESASEDELLPDDLQNDLQDDKSPFEPRVFDLIAQHLSGSDIKNAACVCRKWNQKVSASEQCMKKLLLLIDTFSDENFEQLVTDILASRRCYANLEISLKNDTEISKKVDRILKKFAVSIINLKLTKIGGHFSMLNKKLWLLNLESLELHVVCGRVSGEFLENVCTLKKLTLNGLDPDSLLSCLQQNPTLQELTLYENAFITYFDRNLALALPFNLKKFSILDHLNTDLPLQGELPASPWNPKARLNFLKFLQTQAASLTSLHMDVCFASDLGHIIKVLPSLKCLEVNKIAGDLTKIRLTRNESISRFIASSNRIDGFLLFAIITSCVNLQYMFVHKLQMNQFLFVTRYALSLKKFCYFWATETSKMIGNSVNLKALHEQMAQVDAGINRDIEVHIMKKEQFMEIS